MNYKLVAALFLMLLFAVYVVAAPPKFLTTTAGTSNVSFIWGYKVPIVEIDPDDGVSDTTGTWVSFDGQPDSVYVPADGLVIPRCDCQSVIVRRSSGSVIPRIWLYR